MFSKKENYRFSVILLLILSVLVMIFSACISNYRTFSSNEGIAHFSFEYPSDMKYLKFNDEGYVSEKYITLLFRREIVEDGWFDKDLYIAAFKPPGFNELSISDAKTLLEQDIIRLDEAFEVSKVLERSPVNIGGISGELVVTSWDMMSPRMSLPDGPFEGTPQQPSLMMIGRSAYFDQGGLVWIIRMDSTEEAEEETGEDFAHILKTFKILD